MNNEIREKVEKFLEDRSIEFIVEYLGVFRNKDDCDWEHHKSIATFHRGDSRSNNPDIAIVESFDFHMGMGTNGEPHAADVLHSLCLDIASAEISFEDWCADYGYDSDSRKAERIYNACNAEAKKVRRLFSDDEIFELNNIVHDY